MDCLYCLLKIAILLPEADWLYSLSKKPGLWDKEVHSINNSLKRLAKDTKIVKNHLYKKIYGKYLLFIRPSGQTDILRDTHKLAGHNGPCIVINL